MTWTAPATAVTGDVIPASFWNTNGRDNLLETAVAKVTTAGDLVQATGANALARLPIGTALQVLRTNAGATAAEWATLSGLTLLGSDDTERTSTSTSAADGTAITVSIPVTQAFFISFSARKSSGAAAGVGIGLKINSTVVYEALVTAFTTELWTTNSTDEAQIGSYRGFVTPRDATYNMGNLQGQGVTFKSDGSVERVALVTAPRLHTAGWPNATITSITPRLISGSASVTAAYKNFRIWGYPTT